MTPPIRHLRFISLPKQMAYEVADILERMTGDEVRVRFGHQKRYKIERFNGTQWVQESEGR